MTIYVDRLFNAEGLYHGRSAQQARHVGARRANGNLWCHMVTDGPDDELDAFAERIGLLRRWRDGDHYDLTPGKRVLALKSGAVPVGPCELLAISRYDAKGKPRPDYLRAAIEAEKRDGQDIRETQMRWQQAEMF